MADPKKSLELLRSLSELGFTDEAFAHLHHFRLTDKKALISAHRYYCEKILVFQPGGENELVQQRLSMVLRAYRSGGFQSKDPSVFCALADAAFYELPPIGMNGQVNSGGGKKELELGSEDKSVKRSLDLTVNPSSILFDECVHLIESAYRRLGHGLGWRFLNVSKNVLNAPVKIAFITINPGGEVIPSDHPDASCENGLSHLVESWEGLPPGQSTLQLQVQGLFRALAQGLKFHGPFEDLMAGSLISQFIPFRSPTISALPRKEESIEFGRSLWGRILPVVSPTLIVCLGREVQRELRTLIQNSMDASEKSSRSYETGWGQYKADLDEYNSPHGPVRLLYLPHLSRYQLFGNPKCSPNIQILFEAVCEGL